MTRACSNLSSPRIAIVVGEQSGDNLAAELIQALRQHFPQAKFFGIAGPRMTAVGCEVWTSADALSVMGIFEIIPHLWRLLRLRSQLITRLLHDPPDIYIGVDAKEFNLSVERRLKAAGIRTVQYVSPQVWAWRQGRVKKIANAVDLMLCLLPFETRFYHQHQVEARFVGHPLADQIPMQTDQVLTRTQLGLPMGVPCVAVLPGSRQGEANSLSDDFAQTIAWLIQKQPTMCFVAPMANATVRRVFTAALDRVGVLSNVMLLDGQSQQAMIASDVVLLASGTATLEATLIKRPMVVAYRLSKFTTWLLRGLGMVKTTYFSQPNLLASKPLVPEYLNEQVRSDVLGPAILAQLHREDRSELEAEFLSIHQQLRQHASEKAASAIAELLQKTNG
mgnify:CR=1 FL=1